MKRRITSSFASAAIVLLLVKSLIVCECLKLDADIDHDDVMNTQSSLQKFISSSSDNSKRLDSTPRNLPPPYSNIHLTSSSSNNNVYELKSRRTNLHETYDKMSFYLAADSTLWLTAANSNDQRLAHLFRFESSLNSFEFVEQLHTSRNKLFLNRFNPKIAAVSDLDKNLVKIYKDLGEKPSQVTTPFRPDNFYFTPRDSIYLGAQVNEHFNQLWISLDSGKNWENLSKFVGKSPEWESSKNVNSIYLIDDDSRLVRFEIGATEAGPKISKTILRSGVRSFELIDEKFLFAATQEENNLLVNKLGSKKRDVNDFEPLGFEFETKPTKIIDYQVQALEKTEILVVVSYEANGQEGVRKDLFSCSDFKKLAFKPTLRNIESNPKVLSKRGILLANVRSGEKEKSVVKSMLRLEPGAVWNQVKISPEIKDSHLELKWPNFQFSYEFPESSIGDPRSPDFAITSVKNENGNMQGVYVSRGDVSEWFEALGAGSFVSSHADFGRLLFAIDATRPVDELVYSVNKGFDWRKVKFANHLVLVDHVIALSDTSSSSSHVFTAQPAERFLIVATNPESRKQVMFIVQAEQSTAAVVDTNSLLSYDNIHDDTLKCREKCLSATTKMSICVTDEMKCNGKNDCADSSDESGCNKEDENEEDPSIYEDILEENNKKPSTIPMPSHMKMFSSTDAYRVNILGARVSNKIFKVSFSIDAIEARSDLASVIVEIIRVPSDRGHTPPSESELESGELVHAVEYHADVLESVKDVYNAADDGFQYACIFLVNFKRPEGEIYRLVDMIVFNNRGYEVLSKRETIKSLLTQNTNLILAVATLALSVVFILVVVLYVCFYRSRQYRQVLVEESSLKPEKNFKKRSIFKGGKIGDLQDASLIISNSFNEGEINSAYSAKI